jgi:hypothetical protein
MERSQDSSVGITTGYGLDGPGSIRGGARFFPRQIGRGMKLTTHLHLVQRSVMVELYLYPPRLHSIVLN